MSCYCGDSKNCLQCMPMSKRDEWFRKNDEANKMKKKRSDASKKANKKRASQPVMGDIKSMIPEITVEKMKELLDKARDERKQREHDRYAMPKCEEGVCVVCKGVVTEGYTQVADRDFMHIPIGSASRDCYHWHYDGCHCTKCGLKYEFIPPM